MTRNAFIALSAGLLAATLTAMAAQTDPAAATPPVTSQATTVAPATFKASPEDKVVCKTEIPTGSRLGGQKVCMKKSDWAAQAQDVRRQRQFAPPAGIAGAK